MSNFASLKKSSADIGRLTREIEKINAPTENRGADDRFWKLEVDKAGNGYAVIRFLPGAAVDGDDALPWVRIFNHGFKGPTGKWYIENSLTTLNQKDPVAEYNSQLWNSVTDDNAPERKKVREQKRRLTYVSNIMVISDPKNPSNEGKVFLFKYGKKIFDKLHLAMNPQYPDDPPMSPFNMWNGANFKLKCRKVEGYSNYDLSSFESPSALSDDEDQLKKIWQSEHSLNELLDPKHFKSYDELKRKLNEVLGISGETTISQTRNFSTEETVAKKPSFDGPAKRKSVEDTPPFDTDEDEDLNYFKGLADEE